MSDDELIALVSEYFAGVDGEDIGRVLATLTEDCRFTVETHGVELTGHDEIRDMLERLWAAHAAVRHDRFVFVPAAAQGRIAAQFRVTNTHDDGTMAYKSNCNFFHLRDGRFDSVAVYMAGENTLN
jgi:ketosteroid isomerase-like protein